MKNLPRIWDDLDMQGICKKSFTVGRGKVEYCLWTWGSYGLAYCYRVRADGYACCRRAVEPNASITINIEENEQSAPLPKD